MKKEKYTIEYSMNGLSPQILWPYIGTANGLSEWFADAVENEGRRFVFTWNKMQQEAQLVAYRHEIFARFRWTDDGAGDGKSYFEFRIHQIELTGETILEITDFDEPGEQSESAGLWNAQIGTLKRLLGL